MADETLDEEAGVPLDPEHEHVGAVWDRDSGLRAVIAIHSTALGPSLGGTRYRPYPSFAAAMSDVLRLSRAMSYKAALAGLALGGGKAVIIGDPAAKSEALLRAYAKFLDSFEGRYLTAEDVGTSQADMDYLGRFSEFVTGRSRSLGGSGDPSPITAFGVVRAMEAAADSVLGGNGLEGAHVAINGVGKVGHALALLCHERKAHLTIADVSDEALRGVLAEVPADVSDPEKIHQVACDVYAPCALGGALNDHTVPELSCRVVCGAANNQLSRPDVEPALAARGITYVPDYLANAGGIINIAYEPGGYDESTAREHVSRIYDTTRLLLERAFQSGEHLSVLADRTAEERIRKARASRSSR
jgi:valine dehydrogenase (NAD+)